MNKIFYSAYTCKGNLGDLVINKMQIEEYSRYGEVYVDFTGMPDDFRNIILGKGLSNVKDFVAVYGKSYRGKEFLHIIKFLRSEGFTHFTKSPGPYAVLSLPLKRFVVRLMGAVGYIYAHRLGMKVFALGVDLDYSKQPRWLQWINRKYFSHYDLLGLRSLKNENLLKNDLKNVVYVPDMAFLYQPQKETLIERKRIALSFRRIKDKTALLEELNDLLPAITEAEYSVDVLYQVKEDKIFAEELQKELKGYKINVVPKCIYYDDLTIYSNYDFVFSNRLHVLLLAAKYGAIPFALISNNVKEQKIANIFSSIGMDDLLGYIEDTNGKQWHSLLGDKVNLKQKIKEIFDKQEVLCKNAIGQFLKLE